jgi:hypothetical protein
VWEYGPKEKVGLRWKFVLGRRWGHGNLPNRGWAWGEDGAQGKDIPWGEGWVKEMILLQGKCDLDGKIVIHQISLCCVS